jgi:hypothetical protein
MLGSQTDLFARLIASANSWRSTATTQGFVLSQVNVVFPNGGGPVTLHFNEDLAEWEVSA